ncbi:MMPL family transporter [Gallaecimonas mangrovi]|uniref:hypothetical protein n=1 Tax=Gallaecimonas mangrovi TaxID=2291597 RepID=UPI0012602DCA|nr:hypothetical protein [Gallaecimonas mangrovi]
MRLAGFSLVLVALLSMRLLLGVAPSSQLSELLPKDFAELKGANNGAFTQLKSRFDRQLWLLVEDSNPKTLVKKGNALAKVLDNSDIISAWQGGNNAGYQRLAKFRGQVLSVKDRQASNAQLINRAMALWFGPTPTSLRADPLFTFSDWLQDLRPAGSHIQLFDGWPLWQKDGRYALILSAEINGSAYDAKVQRRVSQWLAALPVKAQALGTVLYAQQGAQQAQREVSRFGSLALVGVLVLIVWGFGGLRALGFMAGLLALSLIGALTALWWCFPHAHWLALVMGASVIGICADYGFHALAAGEHQRAIRGPLLGGLVSSLCAYGVLVLSPFPGLAQLGVAALGGLMVAYCYVRFLTPIPKVASRQWPATLLLAVSRHRPWAKWALLVIVTVWCALGVRQLSFNDDIRQWQPKDPSLEAVANRLAYWLGQRPGGQYLLITAASTEQLLEKEEAIMPRLQALEAKDQLASVLAVSQRCPSLARQRADHQRIRQLWQQLNSQVGGALGPAPALATGLSPEHWPIKEGRLSLLLTDQHTSVMVLQGLSASGAKALNDLTLIDPASQATKTFGHYRDQVLKLLALAFLLLAVVLVVTLKKNGLKVIFASALALAAAAVTPAFLGQPFNLIHALGLMLVLGLSLDYCLFFASKAPANHTLLAVLLSLASSLLAFGLLMASSTPVLAGFGAVVAVGLLCAWCSSLLWARSS